MGWIRMTDYMCMKGCNRGIRENEIVLTAEGMPEVQYVRREWNDCNNNIDSYHMLSGEGFFFFL